MKKKKCLRYNETKREIYFYPLNSWLSERKIRAKCAENAYQLYIRNKLNFTAEECVSRSTTQNLIFNFHSSVEWKY